MKRFSKRNAPLLFGNLVVNQRFSSRQLAATPPAKEDLRNQLSSLRNRVTVSTTADVKFKDRIRDRDYFPCCYQDVKLNRVV